MAQDRLIPKPLVSANDEVARTEAAKNNFQGKNILLESETPENTLEGITIWISEFSDFPLAATALGVTSGSLAIINIKESTEDDPGVKQIISVYDASDSLSLKFAIRYSDVGNSAAWRAYKVIDLSYIKTTGTAFYSKHESDNKFLSKSDASKLYGGVAENNTWGGINKYSQGLQISLGHYIALKDGNTGIGWGIRQHPTNENLTLSTRSGSGGYTEKVKFTSDGNMYIKGNKRVYSSDEVYSKAEVDSHIKASSTMVGEIIMWGGSTAPAGWLECNGQSTGSYPKLRAIIGSSTPDLRGQFVRGWDHGRNLDKGRDIRTSQGYETKSHTHTANHNHSATSNTTGNHTHTYHEAYYGGSGIVDWHDHTHTILYRSKTTSSAGNHSHTITVNTKNLTTSSFGGAETRPTNIALMYIVKHD